MTGCSMLHNIQNLVSGELGKQKKEKQFSEALKIRKNYYVTYYGGLWQSLKKQTCFNH